MSARLVVAAKATAAARAVPAVKVAVLMPGAAAGDMGSRRSEPKRPHVAQ